MQLFSFIPFFNFCQKFLQNRQDASKNCQFPPGGQNMKHRNKSHEIKKVSPCPEMSSELI